MAIPDRKKQAKSSEGFMDEPPNLLEAVLKIDLKAVKDCLREDSGCIHQLDPDDNNAMHICVAGGFSRMKHIVIYLLQETEINLLQKNSRGRIPIDIAFAINDHEAAKILEEPTLIQINKKYPDEKPDLNLV